MWFASIWIFTLELPWQLGAEFFMQHLYDGDAASNTLGWRWVAGVQTQANITLRVNGILKNLLIIDFKIYSLMKMPHQYSMIKLIQ
jgi:deoxyribodipyrimidine photolyase